MSATGNASRARGKITIRTTKAVTIAAGIDFPGAAQAVQIIRRTRSATGPRRWSTEVAYAVTSVPTCKAGPELLGAWVRGHWGIENRLHYIREVPSGRTPVRSAPGLGHG